MKINKYILLLLLSIYRIKYINDTYYDMLKTKVRHLPDKNCFFLGIGCVF